MGDCIQTEYEPSVFDAILEVGAEFQIKPYGYQTINSLRIEKSYRHWCHDITDEHSTLEADLGFTCKYDKSGGFLGREALLEHKEHLPLSKRLVALKFTDPEPLCYHEEPIFANCAVGGRVTSAMFGHTVGAPIAVGYVQNDQGVTPDWLAQNQFEIEVEH
ncbi:MAG: glycine cleavage system aminomethyltransferase T [Marinomonas primoryensis]